MSKSPSKQKEKPLVRPNTNGSKTNKLEATKNSTPSTVATQVCQQLDEAFDEEILIDIIIEMEGQGVYLNCNQVQKVRGGYRVYVDDITDVRRAK